MLGVDVCRGCGHEIDLIQQRRGRNNAKRGKSHSLAISRKYGMAHVENDSSSGKRGPVDSLGVRWKQQNKSKQSAPPLAWSLMFQAMDGVADGRLPRILLRYLPGPGQKAQDFFIVRGDDWLSEFGDG